MTRRKRQFSFVRLLLVILIVVALIVIAFFGTKLVLNKINNDTTDDTEIKDTEVIPENESEDVRISIVDYKIYKDNDNELGFNFILADLKFESQSAPIYYGLDKLSTAERIYLNNIEYYESKLQALGIELSTLNYVKTIKDDSNTVTCKVFIPYENVKGELNVYNGEVLKFDLTKNINTIESLKLKDDTRETVIESNDYNITVYDSYIADLMYKDGEEARYPSTIDIYTFEIHVNSISKDNVYVEKAQFVPNGTSNVHDALDASYKSLKIDNIIKKNLSEGDTYALFFAITNSGEIKESFNGKLLIKFSNSNTWVELSTVKE